MDPGGSNSSDRAVAWALRIGVAVDRAAMVVRAFEKVLHRLDANVARFVLVGSVGFVGGLWLQHDGVPGRAATLAQCHGHRGDHGTNPGQRR